MAMAGDGADEIRLMFSALNGKVKEFNHALHADKLPSGVTMTSPKYRKTPNIL